MIVVLVMPLADLRVVEGFFDTLGLALLAHDEGNQEDECQGEYGEGDSYCHGA